MSEWISVKERLPEPGKVLVTDGKSVRMTNGAWFYRASAGETRAPANYGAGITVTHWMPLPEPPVAVAENAMTTATASETERVRCADCKHLMFSDCYGECAAGHRGIVRPEDTCPHGVRRADHEAD